MISADLRHTPRAQSSIRALDLGLVFVTIPVWLPLVAVISLVILVTSGRPVFFRQTRIGRDEVPFTMVKFRSMLAGKNPLVPDPTRITTVGRFLRRTSLDELPQVLNVIQGQMSLVGPRPMLASQLMLMDERDRRRSSVRPGLTGSAQINGRNSLSWDERFVHDLAWVDDPSIRSYLSTIRRTVRVMITGDGVAGHDPDDRLVVEPPTVIQLIDFDLCASDSETTRQLDTQDRAAR